MSTTTTIKRKADIWLPMGQRILRAGYWAMGTNDMHRDLENPGNFLFFENWATKDQWLAHMESPQLLAYKAVADDLVDVFELYQMEKVD